MEVTGLFRKSVKGAPPETLGEWTLDTGGAGDPRQVSLISLETAEAMERMGRRGLCMKRFFANMEIAGLPSLSPGDCLAVGDVVLEITDARKQCFAECPLVREGADCPLKNSCRFARVARGGRVAVHDRSFRLPRSDT